LVILTKPLISPMESPRLNSGKKLETLFYASMNWTQAGRIAQFSKK